jgi:surface polysaccharide O-acyltransferase-like enzyme
MKKTDKIEYTHINLIKILACILVIINHTVNHVLSYKTPGVDIFFCLLFSLCKIAVPIFIICSGYLILKKDYTYKKIGKNIVKILIPLLVISCYLYVKGVGFKNINVIDFLKQFLSAPYIKPYWYLYMLPGLYLITPFMQKMVKNFEKKDYYYFIIFFLIIPAILKLLLACFNIHYSSYWLIAFVPYVLGYYAYGNFLNNNYPGRNLIVARIIFWLSFIGFFLLTYLPSIYGDGISYKFDDVSSLPVVLMSLSLFYIFDTRFRDKKYGKKSLKVINTVASTTFGIYLFHHIIGYKAFTIKVMVRIFTFNAMIGYLIALVLVFIVCSLLTYILKKIPIIRNYL